jgi:hypothetical protein
MNPTPPAPDPHDAWTRLAGWHRDLASGQDQAAPFGFSGRVVARWMEQRRDDWRAAWERTSLRAAAACSAVAAAVTLLAGGPATPDDSGDVLLLPAPEVPAEISRWLS